MSRYKEVGKGDSQRKAQVPDTVVASNWDRIFSPKTETVASQYPHLAFTPDCHCGICTSQDNAG